MEKNGGELFQKPSWDWPGELVVVEKYGSKVSNTRPTQGETSYKSIFVLARRMNEVAQRHVPFSLFWLRSRV